MIQQGKHKTSTRKQSLVPKAHVKSWVRNLARVMPGLMRQTGWSLKLGTAHTGNQVSVRDCSKNMWMVPEA